METYTESGKVICQECGIGFGLINATHLKKEHNMTVESYKDKYPGLPISSKALCVKHRKQPEGIFDKITEIINEVPIESCEEFNMDKIPKIQKETNIQEDFLSEIKTFARKHTLQEYPNPNNSIHKKKLLILNFLLNFFQDTKDSYYIEKISLSGMLEYRLISDISIPSRKINLEFPNTFWHNMDIPKFNRDTKLKNDGWTIINILEENATPNIVEKELRKNNLI